MARLGALRLCVASDSVFVDNHYGATQMTDTITRQAVIDADAIERALCEANGCVWDLDAASDSRQQWRRDVRTVLAALQEQSK
jgi:hypothetical protein